MSQATISFDDVFRDLNILEYKEAIFKSNSHGELFHIWEYLRIWEFYREYKQFDISEFRDWFIETVELAKKDWNRPESIYQHIKNLFIIWISKKTTNEKSI